jgi:conjugal transfer pilus assembly protein TraB
MKDIKNVKGGVKAYLESLSPRARQWTTLGGLFAVGGVILWAVFSYADANKDPKVARAAKDKEAKPTQVALMTPGQSMSEQSTWIATGQKKLEQYAQERDQQRRMNDQLSERDKKMSEQLSQLETQLREEKTRREELERKVKDKPIVATAPVAPPPAAATSAAKFPPPAALAKGPGVPAPAGPPGMRQTPAGPIPDGAGLGRFGEVASSLPAQPALLKVTLPQAKQADGHTTVPGAPGVKDLNTFLPVSFTRGILLGGVDAPTGGQSQSNPHPILIRLSDNSFLPNRFRAEYRECFVIAAAYGDISSERAYGRTESLSCIREDGTALEVKIQGSIYGEDGKVGMRGRLVTKQGQMLANALMAGIVGGIGQGISQANTTTFTSALGSVNTQSGTEALRAGVGSGVGKALDRLSQYYIKLAEQTFPVIEIDAGREIDVVITKGVRVDGSDERSASASRSASPGSPQSPPRRPSVPILRGGNNED